MLGQELVRVFSLDGQYEVAGWDREDIYPAPIVPASGESSSQDSIKKPIKYNRCRVDVTDFVAAEQKIREYEPEIILNAVAYNEVDKCEESGEEYKKALLLNGEVPKFLARVAKEIGAVLVHYSTDYVFEGALETGGKEADGCASGKCCGGNCHGGKEVGYDETALPNPLSRYGTSKYLGEQGVRKEAPKYYLIRLSKLFGKEAKSAQGKKSFFDLMLEAGKTKEVVQVVDDEKSCFTYAPDLAVATKELIESGDSFGTYHLVNTGAVTWYEAVLDLYAQAHIGVTIQPVGSDAFPRHAQRPHVSVLINTKRPPLRPYREALSEYLKNI